MRLNNSNAHALLAVAKFVGKYINIALRENPLPHDFCSVHLLTLFSVYFTLNAFDCAVDTSGGGILLRSRRPEPSVFATNGNHLPLAWSFVGFQRA